MYQILTSLSLVTYICLPTILILYTFHLIRVTDVEYTLSILSFNFQLVIFEFVVLSYFNISRYFIMI